MRLSISLLVLCGFSSGIVAAPLISDQSILSVINNSGSPIQISYLKTNKGPLFKKLVEQGEALTFGVVSEAMISGAGVIGQYLTPAPFRFFPADRVRSIKHYIVNVKGTKDRSLTKPFGEWDIVAITKSSPEQLFPPLRIPKKDMIIDAFPTAVRNGIPTPRFILGLSYDATLADAVEAEVMLIEKWSSAKTINPSEGRIINSIFYIINKAREAFELNNPDEPLSELVPPQTFTFSRAE